MSEDEFDVLVVGGGPGGIAAAVVAAEAGRSVGIVDDNPFPGGQIWRNRGEAPKSRVATDWLRRLNRLSPLPIPRQRVTARAETSDATLAADASQPSPPPVIGDPPEAPGEGVVSHHPADRGASGAGKPQSILRLQQSRVIANPGPNSLLIETPDGPCVMKWKSLVLATGARELFLPFPGWTLPGVIGAGGMQALVKQGLPVRGKRIVVAGSGPLLLAVADLMKTMGAEVPVILEQTPARKVNAFGLSLLKTPGKLLAGIGLRARLLGTRYATGCYPNACRLRLHESETADPRSRKRQTLVVEYRSAKRGEEVDCDYLACGFGLIPNNELPALLGCEIIERGMVRVDDSLRTTIENVYAVGELTGVGGVEKALLEGEIAGLAITDQQARVSALQPQLKQAIDFTNRLADAFTLRPELFKLAQPDTLICRCEDVPLSAVQNSIDARDARLQTRCGMGPCQGRVCGPIMQNLLLTEPPVVRPPILTASIGSLAAGSGAGRSSL